VKAPYQLLRNSWYGAFMACFINSKSKEGFYGSDISNKCMSVVNAGKWLLLCYLGGKHFPNISCYTDGIW
jgi:hypothetical protein